MAAMSPLLAHDVVAGAASSSNDVVVFAHGILGSRGNWRGFARRLVDASPESTALVVDLRNHGESHGFSEPHTVEAAAKDIAALCQHLGKRPRVVVGHSWGGKAALQLALTDKSVDVVVAVDCPPGGRRFSGGERSSPEEIDRVLAAVTSVPMPVASRRDLVALLKDRGLSDPIAQWMTTNLDAEMRWKFNLAAIPSMLASFGKLDLWPALWAKREGLGVHLVRGGRSDRWSSEELARADEALAGHVVVNHIIEHAGHWVHTDDPQRLLAVVLSSMPSSP